MAASRVMVSGRSEITITSLFLSMTRHNPEHMDIGRSGSPPFQREADLNSWWDIRSKQRSGWLHPSHSYPRVLLSENNWEYGICVAYSNRCCSKHSYWDRRACHLGCTCVWGSGRNKSPFRPSSAWLFDLPSPGGGLSRRDVWLTSYRKLYNLRSDHPSETWMSGASWNLLGDTVLDYRWCACALILSGNENLYDTTRVPEFSPNYFSTMSFSSELIQSKFDLFLQLEWVSWLLCDG
jgi:hypothetical protein